ncbi:Pr6Pr family membrane protein [Streptomyces avidinii]|uniref:Pr6Pr family membrane protein n=1 Tax=Streptomyces avidinii TaxID=1895 RepID=UPI003799009C
MSPPRDGATWLGALAATVLTTGVTCQFLQHTDPTPPLLYFTVDSAVLAAAVQIRRLVHGPGSGPWDERLRGSAVVGVVLSSLVYLTVIAPSSPSGGWFGTHDDVWARTATLLLHGAAPVLVVAEFLVSPCRPAPAHLAPARHEAALLAWWPGAYLAVVGTLAWSGAATMPYLFLSPSRFGTGPVIATIAALFATVLALAAALTAAHRRLARPPGAHA